KRPDGTLEPLAALYETRALLRAGRRALGAGLRRVTAAFEGLRVAFYALGPEDEAKLTNVNTPEDYQRMHTKRSESLFSAASRLIPGGVNSPVRAFRSEEHTSELQSRENLVCRLLLE